MSNPKYPHSRTVWMTSKMYHEVKAIVKAKGMTQAAYFRQAIQTAMDKEDDFNKPEIWTVKEIRL